jgi:hypothetical protein
VESRSKEMCFSCTKTEYLRCNFSEKEQEDGLEVTIGENVVTGMTKFKYLRFVSTVMGYSNGVIDGDVTYRMKVGRVNCFPYFWGFHLIE